MNEAEKAALSEVVGVARNAAGGVDRDGVFPAAAVGELKRQRLLVPAWDLQTSAEAVRLVAEACGSTGLVWAMHLAIIETLRRHAPAGGPVRQFLDRSRQEQPLIAGATSEVGVGGDIRRSVTSVSRQGSEVTVQKEVPFASYILEADAIIVTARRDPSALPSDQVLVLASRPQAIIEQTGIWDALGMRGTASGSATVTVTTPADQVLPTSFGVICAETMAPVSHTLWAACWSGIAADAVAITRRVVRSDDRNADLAAARRIRFGEVHEHLTMLRAMVDAALRAANAPMSSAPKQEAARTAFFNEVKTGGAELAVKVVLGCLELIGAPAYLEERGSRCSLARHLRDILSAKVMVSADRIRAATGQLGLLSDMYVLPEEQNGK